MKYVIDIEDKPFKQGDKELYKCRQFNTLVFDKNGLDKLMGYEGQKHAIADNARKEAWALMQKLVRLSHTKKWDKIYPGMSVLTVILNESYDNVKASIERIKEKPDPKYKRGQEWITEFNDRVVIAGETDVEDVFLVLCQNGDMERMNKSFLKTPTNRSYPHFGEMVFAMNNP